jgi:PAS domain S-box-containing protein
MRYFPFISRAPSFEDEDKSRAAALLHFILVSTSLANIAAILARPFLPAGQTLGPVSANIFIQLVLIALFFLMWKGQVRLAGFILTAFMWMLLSLGAYANSGILNPIFGAQTVVIVMAGLLIGEAAGLGFAVFSSAFGWWLVQLAETGKYPGEMGSITTQVTWMNDTTAFVLTGLMLFLSLRTIREARKQTAQHTRSRRYSDERYRALVENAPDTIFTLDQQHRISYLSRSTLAPVETLIGKAVYDFLHPDSRDAYRAAVSRVLELGSVEQIEVQNLRPGEQSSWYSVRFAPIREAGKVIEVTAISTDITNHKLADTALRSSEERYHHALDSLLEGAQIIGFDWRYLYVNDTVAGHGREAKERLLRSTMIEVYPGIENTPMFATLRTCMEERTAQQIENEFVYPDGSKAWFELSVQPVPEGIFILSLDVTERKRSEAALRESEARLRGRIESAMDAIITIDESQHLV